MAQRNIRSSTREERSMKARQLQGQPVTTSFVVKKKWKEKRHESEHPESKLVVRAHERTISAPFMSRDAANTFMALAVKESAENPVRGQLEVEFFVADNRGRDGLPKGF
jgi:hypothetical protein